MIHSFTLRPLGRGGRRPADAEASPTPDCCPMHPLKELARYDELGEAAGAGVERCFEGSSGLFGDLGYGEAGDAEARFVVSGGGRPHRSQSRMHRSGPVRFDHWISACVVDQFWTACSRGRGTLAGMAVSAVSGPSHDASGPFRLEMATRRSQRSPAGLLRVPAVPASRFPGFVGHDGESGGCLLVRLAHALGCGVVRWRRHG
jgi:hypothetical protein